MTGEDESRTVEAVLEDISPLGGCVQVEEEIPLGSTITLWLSDSQFAGHVCYCVYRDYGYFVGVRFSDETVWSPETVAPEHLINLEEIAQAAAGYKGI